MHDYDVATTLNDLHKTFHEFKTVQDDRLNQLESTGQVPMDLDDKIARIEWALQETEQKLQKLQAANLRPQIPTPAEDSHEMNETFSTYLRKGQFSPWDQKALSTDPDAEGGYVVPDGIDYTLRQILQQQSVLRRLASVRQISTGSLELLIDKEMADAGWVDEKDDRPETDTPELESLRILTHEMYAKPRATQRLLDDANINVEEWICQKIAQKMTTMENEAFLHGDGTSQPQGILSYETDEGNNVEWGELEELKTGADGAFQEGAAVESLICTFHSLKTQYLQGACWLMPRSAQARIRSLKDPNTGLYLWQPALSEGSCSTLLGHPVHLCDAMPSLDPGTASKSILFGNFKEGYQIVDRQSTRVLRDPYSAKPFVEFYTTRRVGGAVVNFEALKVLNFAA